VDTYYSSVREQVVGAGKRHLSVWNGAGSGKMVTIFRIKVVGAPIATAAGLKVSLGVVRLTSAPGGGTVGAWAKAVTANPNVPSQVEIRAAPTSGNIETTFFAAAEVNPEETSAADNGLLYEAPIDGSQPLTLAEGEGIEVRQGTLAGASTLSFVVTIGLA
jgi:hypothetical protein